MSPLLIAAGGIGTLAVGLVAAFIVLRPGGSTAAAWSRLGTGDVHSLAFVGDDPKRLLFGHHGGVLSSSDGGRSWEPLATRSDAMSLGPGGDGSIVFAGHEVLAASHDDGRTWEACRRPCRASTSASRAVVTGQPSTDQGAPNQVPEDQ